MQMFPQAGFTSIQWHQMHSACVGFAYKQCVQPTPLTISLRTCAFQEQKGKAERVLLLWT